METTQGEQRYVTQTPQPRKDLLPSSQEYSQQATHGQSSPGCLAGGLTLLGAALSNG